VWFDCVFSVVCDDNAGRSEPKLKQTKRGRKLLYRLNLSTGLKINRGRARAV
jgi:hypothetical protein